MSVDESIYDQLIEPFQRYLRAPNTDYGLLLDGAWGCGKTFFVRNHLFPEAISAGFKPVYFSLSAARDPAQILRHVLLSKLLKKPEVAPNGGIVESALSIFSSLPAVGSYGSAVKGAGKILADVLSSKVQLSDVALFLDDIERTPSNDQIPELLGTVFTQLVDQRSAKVIIIGHLKEVLTTLPKFAAIREKYIRAIVPFKLPLAKLMEKYIAVRCQDSPELLAYLRKEAIQIFLSNENRGASNLRTVGYIIDCFRPVFLFRSLDAVREALSGLLSAITVLSIEYASGRLPHDDPAQMEKLAKASWDYYYWESQSRRGSQSEEKPSSVTFVETYGISTINKLVILPSICRLILGWGFDSDKFREELKVFQSAGKTEWAIALEQLADFRPLEHDDLKKVAFEVLTFAESGRYHLSAYPYVYSLLNFLKNNGYLTSIPDDLSSRLEAGVEKASATGDPIRDLDDTIVSHRFDGTRPPDEHILKLVELVKQKARQQIAARSLSAASSFLRKLGALTQEEFANKYHDLRGEIKFSQFTSDDLCELLLSLNNAGIHRVEVILRDKITSISNAGSHYYDDKAVLEAVGQVLVDRAADKGFDETRVRRIQDLANALRGAAEHLERTKTTP